MGKWILLLFLVPLAVGQTVELGLERPLPANEFLFVSGPAEGTGSICGGGEWQADLIRNEFISFSEGADVQGCGSAFMNLVAPMGARRLEVQFTAGRTIDGVAGQIGTGNVFVQQVRLQDETGINSVEMFATPGGSLDARLHNILFDFVGGNVQLGWYFEDRGLALSDANQGVNLPGVAAMSAQVDRPLVRFRGIDIEAHSTLEGRPLGGNYEEVLSMRFDVPGGWPETDRPFLDLAVNSQYGLLSIRGPDGNQFSPQQMELVARGGGTLHIPPAVMQQTGAGMYQIEFVAPSYAVPEPYLGPLAVLAFVFPLGTILVSWREYRFTRDTVDMASTLLVWLWRTAIASIFGLMIWILVSRSFVGMLYWPPRLEYVLYFAVLFASGALMIFFMFLWRRQALIATLDREMQRRRAAQEELERSNRDLEMFAYVASHDMKQPLRMVKFYTQRLKDKYKGKLDADADEFIDFAAGNAERMEQLLQGLLEYSRVDSAEATRERVDLDELVVNTRQKLQLLLKENNGEISSSSLGTVTGNYTQMSQLFQNLAENAMKYRSKSAPRVHFERVGNMIRCIDNGQGIPEKDRVRVFKLFKRLNTEEGGEGIGLALCLRIVEQHGGTIRARTNPGGGTIMEFTIGS